MSRTNPAVIVRHQARFSLLSDGLVRMEYAPDGRFEERRSVRAAFRPAPVPFSSVTERGGQVTLKTRRFLIRYRPNGRPFSARNLQVCDARTGRRLWAPGQVDRRNLGGAHTSLDVMQRCYIPKGVHPATTTYHPNGYTAELWNFLNGPDGNTWQPHVFNDLPLDQVLATYPPERIPDYIRRLFRERAKYPPGILSRAGYFLYNDSDSAVYDPATDWPTARGTPGHRDYYLFVYDRDFAAALRDYRLLFGPVPLPPRYAFGLWYSRYPTFNDTQLRALVDEFEQRDLPLDVLVLDLEWHRHGWSGFDWNTQHIRDPEGLIRFLHRRHTHVTLNVHPKSHTAQDSRFRAFQRAAGIADGAYDFSVRRQADAYLNVLMGPVTEQGVDFWWLDGCAPTRAVPGLERLFWSNHVFASDIARRRPARRPMIFSRSAGLGSHRYPCHFTGDAFSQWEVLESQIEYTLRAGHIGQSLITHDIGGFITPFHTLDPELFLRWVQWGVLSPLFRLHSSFGGERRPWLYGEKFERAFRRAFGLRMALLPYLYTLARAGHLTGMPLLRSNALAFPGWKKGYTIWSGYALGDRLYATPVVRPGDFHTVCLPPGRWYDAHTGARLVSDGRREFTHLTPLDKGPPHFIKAGALLVKQPYARRAARLPKTLIVELYPAGRRARDRFDLYEDDGLTRAHGRGEAAVTRFDLEEHTDLRLTIHPARGRYQGQPERRAYEIRVFGGGTWRFLVNGRTHVATHALSQPKTADTALAVTLANAPAGDAPDQTAAPYTAIRIEPQPVARHLAVRAERTP